MIMNTVWMKSASQKPRPFTKMTLTKMPRSPLTCPNHGGCSTFIGKRWEQNGSGQGHLDCCLVTSDREQSGDQKQHADRDIEVKVERQFYEEGAAEQIGLDEQ